MKKAALVYSDDYMSYDFGPNHPLKPARLRMTHALIHAYGLLSDPGAMEVAPLPATDADILTVHSEAFLEAVKYMSRGRELHDAARFGFGILDNPPFDGMYEASLMYTGGTVTAAGIIGRGEARAAFNPSGGLHHAMRDRASGFCIFDDIAIAIEKLLERHERVLYLDIDAHHGDGVQQAFYDSPRVMTISQHESGNHLFPGTGYVEELGEGEGRGYSVNIPLSPYTDDETYLWAFREVVPPLMEHFDPQVVVLQAGADGHYRDPLAHLNLTTKAYEEIFRYVASLDKPILAVGGGGYHLDAVPRIWTLLFAHLLGCELPDSIPLDYAVEYGTRALRDKGGPKTWRSEMENIRAVAQVSVAKVKEQVFGVLGL